MSTVVTAKHKEIGALFHETCWSVTKSEVHNNTAKNNTCEKKACSAVSSVLLWCVQASMYMHRESSGGEQTENWEDMRLDRLGLQCSQGLGWGAVGRMELVEVVIKRDFSFPCGIMGPTRRLSFYITWGNSKQKRQTG